MTVQLKKNLTRPPEHVEEITGSIWRSSLRAQEHFRFFHRVVQGTLQALQTRSYTAFDAQTTSNCCHGLSVLARRLILSLLSQLDRLNSLVNTLPYHDLIDHLPSALIDLTSLHVLTIIIERHPERGRHTHPKKLKSLAPLSTTFCKKIVKKLQKAISVYVAETYYNLGISYEGDGWISGTQLMDWCRYLGEDYIRMDKRGVKYASALFSMQICLHYLSAMNATIALVCDLMEPGCKILKGRYIRIFKSDENCKWIPVELEEEIKVDEPIFVLRGYAAHKTLSIDHLSFRLEAWIHQLPALILACDLHYPEFPMVRDDPVFDSSRIQPKENPLVELFEKLKKIPGFSSIDPSIYCLSHIFLASYESLVDAQDDNLHSESFLNCYIPSPLENAAQT